MSPGPLSRNFAAWRALRLALMAFGLVAVIVTLVATLGHGNGSSVPTVPGVPAPSINQTCNAIGLCAAP